MKEEIYQFRYKIFDSFQELNQDDQALLKAAQDATAIAYAPYSKFNVGAAAKLANGNIVKGGNQENASFPAGICAEGVVLAMVAAQFPKMPVETLAISYHSSTSPSDHPIAPCGICRQTLQEFREKTGSPVRLIMGGMQGRVIIVDDASMLLPFSFKF